MAWILETATLTSLAIGILTGIIGMRIEARRGDDARYGGIIAIQLILTAVAATTFALYLIDMP